MTLGQKRNIERLKKLQIEAKKIRAKNPKLSHIEAVKIAAGKTPCKELTPAKKALVKQKFKTVGAKKITEKKILQKIHKVKKNVNQLDEAQHEHILQKSIGKLQSTYIALFSSPGKVSMQKFKTTSIQEARKLASAFKKSEKIKGSLKVSKHSHI
jgi:hypothetical protein